jgi:hypothetical protein
MGQLIPLHHGDAEAARRKKELEGGSRGGAVQVDPQLESARFQPLNLKCDILVSKFAFKCNLYRYTGGVPGRSRRKPTWSGKREWRCPSCRAWWGGAC